MCRFTDDLDKVRCEFAREFTGESGDRGLVHVRPPVRGKCESSNTRFVELTAAAESVGR
jgi:hypothetical protein